MLPPFIGGIFLIQFLGVSGTWKGKKGGKGTRGVCRAERMSTGKNASRVTDAMFCVRSCGGSFELQALRTQPSGLGKQVPRADTNN